jgi:hypothetical protein
LWFSEGFQGLVIPDYYPVLIDFDRPRSLVSHHLPKDLRDNALVDKARQVIDFFYLEGIDKISGFIDESDLDIMGQMTPECCSIQV